MGEGKFSEAREDMTSIFANYEDIEWKLMMRKKKKQSSYPRQ